MCSSTLFAKLLLTFKIFTIVILIQVLSPCFCSNFSISSHPFLFFFNTMAYLSHNIGYNIDFFCCLIFFLVLWLRLFYSVSVRLDAFLNCVQAPQLSFTRGSVGRQSRGEALCVLSG